MKNYGKQIEAEPGSPPAGMYVPIEFPSLVVLGERTRDGRLVTPEGFSPLDLPRTVYMQTRQAGGHDGAVVAARLDYVAVDGKNVSGGGWIIDNPDGRMAAHLVKTQVLRGNSIDMSVAQKDIDMRFIEEGGSYWMEVDMNNARLSATTLVGKPAFDNAGAVIPDGWDVEGVDAPEEAIVAAMSSYAPDHAFSFTATDTLPRLDPTKFADPKLTEPTPPYVDEDNVVYGHIAAWGTLHVDAAGLRLTPPKSHTNYAYFANTHVLTEDGMLPSARLVIDGNHADKAAMWRTAIDHYANTCAAWADVSVGEDEFGIWFAGIVRPGTSAEVIHAARASVLSGDWRHIGGGLELVAALSVNAGGFPIARSEPSHAAGFAHADGMQLSLLGAGMLERTEKFGTIQPFKVPASLEYLATKFATDDARVIAAELEALGQL